MVFKRKNKFTRRRKTFRRRPARISRFSMVNRAKKQFMPPTYYTKHVYADYEDVSAAGIQTYKYRVNGLFDPYAPVGGTQPYGFDQLTAMYSRYCVYGIAYKVHFLSTDTTSGNSQMVGIRFSPNTTVVTNLKQMIEDRRSQIRPLTSTDGSRGVQTFKGYMAVNTIFGLTKNRYMGEQNYHGTITADAPVQAYLHVMGAPVIGANSEFYHIVELQYYVKWYQPVTTASS